MNGMDEYGEEGVPQSGHAEVPRWLLWTYLLLPIWGVITLYIYWHGSFGWLDRGYWKELQQAANTRPISNMER